MLTEPTDMTYSKSLSEAIKELKDAEIVLEGLGLHESLGIVFREFDRMHAALKFYADRNNYDGDGIVCREDELGLLDEPDEGEKARWALRQTDYAGHALTPEQIKEIKAEQTT